MKIQKFLAANHTYTQEEELLEYKIKTLVLLTIVIAITVFIMGIIRFTQSNYVQAIADNNIRESFLEFNEEADNAFDFEDGLMLFGNNYNSVEPYFSIPTPEINDSTTQLIKDAFSSLPYTTELDLRSQKSNEVSLDFSNIPSNIHVYLLDSLLNK